MPTIPQPDPSSRTLSSFLSKSFSRIRILGCEGVFEGGVEREARYEEKTNPASLE